jgi:hypothetical protein
MGKNQLTTAREIAASDAATRAVTEESKKEKKQVKSAAEIFVKNPSVQELYFTSDGLAFFERTDALNHARVLKDSDISTVKR